MPDLVYKRRQQQKLCSFLMADECWVIDDSVEGYDNGLNKDSPWFEHRCNVMTPWEELKILFWKFEENGFGEMTAEHLRDCLGRSEFRAAILSVVSDSSCLHRLELRAASNNSKPITYQEFIDLVSNKRRHSFQVAVHEQDQEVASLNNFKLVDNRHRQLGKRMAKAIAQQFLPNAADRKFYEDQYSCCPPPVFILLITVVEILFFAYYTTLIGDLGTNSPVPVDSIFIYRHDKRVEVWRFLLYMVLHAGWVHLAFNLLVQILVGLPLEMVHGSCRIALVYMAGVLAGSLGTSVIEDSDVDLVGSSGGVYALLAAHAANVLLNYSQMEHAIMRVVCIIVVASVDVGFAIWDRYSASLSTDLAQPAVSYVSHFAGALAGLTVGLIVLKSFEQRLRDQCIWWTAVAVYCCAMLFAIVWNVFH